MGHTSIDLDQELPELGADLPTVDAELVADPPGVDAAAGIDLSAVDAELVADLAAWDVQEIDGDVDVDAAMQLDAATLVTPPERVRFTAPLQLRQEGAAAAAIGSVVNLSVTGLACVLAVDLEPGERVWAEFALGLADEPMHLLCEVIWRRRSSEGAYSVYGLRFLSMTAAETADLDAWVRERVEGRAGAWPLPVLPSAADVRGPRGASPWLTAAAGMAAGIGLALLLSVVPTSSIGATPQMVARHPLHPLTPMATPAPTPAPAVAPAPASARHTAGSRATALTSSAGRPAAASAHTAAARPAASASSAGEAPTAATSQHAAAAMAELAAQGGLRSPHPTSTPLPRLAPAAPAEQASVLHPVGTASEMHLSLLTDGPVEGHVAFWLNNPRRLVIDVPHRKNGFAHASYTIDHPLASRLRIGNHPDKVRFVIEVAPDVAPRADTHAHGDALDVVLHRR